MKPVSELLRNRPPEVFSTSPDVTVFDALHALAKYGVGALMVLVNGKLVGVFSERDYTRKVALQGRNSREIKVSDIMTANVVTVSPKTGTRECMSVMSQHKIRHLPVVDGGQVVGMISIRDLMDDIIAEHEKTIEHLRTYIQS